jgi:ABC-type phosphate transport system permease subunit
MESLEDTFSDLASFSLANSVGEISNESLITNYYFLIYTGIALIVIILAVIIYKSYFIRKTVRFSEENNNEILQQIVDENIEM